MAATMSKIKIVLNLTITGTALWVFKEMLNGLEPNSPNSNSKAC
jgi:hypothetical protein